MNWTPLSEKYPNNEDIVLFTVHDKIQNTDYVEFGCYFCYVDQETAEITDVFTTMNEETVYKKDDILLEVTAWMPVPPPYKKQFRVIVAGSRTFKDYDLLEKKLDKIFEGRKPTSIVCGCAQGVDQLGKEYAVKHNIQVDEYPADWENEGKSAGYKRNERMAENADALIAFHDGESKGTKHMIDTAKKKELQTRVIKF